MLLAQESHFEKLGPRPASHSRAVNMPLTVKHLFGVTDGSASTMGAKDSTTQEKHTHVFIGMGTFIQNVKVLPQAMEGASPPL